MRSNFLQQAAEKLEAAGVNIPEILLPDIPADKYGKWPVVACDQFTSQPSYWEGVESHVGSDLSTLRLILPEIYLSGDVTGRINAIHNNMDDYMRAGVFLPPYKGFILTRHEYVTDGSGRTDGNARWGLVVSVDLEKYSYAPDAGALMRASEETVRDRLPPRIDVRRGAALELPHVLVLADDPEQTLIEPLARDATGGLLKTAYEVGLMEGGGRLRGYYVDGPAIIKAADSLWNLFCKAKDMERDPLLFAVGDGNHSLAAAKAFWEFTKETYPPDKLCNHPARYALVELTNLHSDALAFKPIHRALYNADPPDVLNEARKYFNDGNMEIAPEKTVENPADMHLYTVRQSSSGTALPVVALQRFIDNFCERRPGVTVDYIHGTEELLRLARDEGRFCFKLPPFDKNLLFPMLAANGPLPRKSFSLGGAREKRYYLEARKILP